MNINPHNFINELIVKYLQINIKMKNTYKLCIILLFIILNSFWTLSQSIENKWVLYPHAVNFNEVPPEVMVLPGANPNYNGEYADANGAFTQDGELLFYLLDRELFNGNGDYFGYLAPYSVGFSYSMRETYIVPVPGSNTRYFIIYGMCRVLSGVELLYATVDCENGTCSIVNNGNILNFTGAGNVHGLAVSRLYEDNTRRMYYATYGYIKRFEISPQGITMVETILGVPNQYNVEEDDFHTNQLELSNNGSKLAWGSPFSDYNNNYQLHIINLNELGSFSAYNHVRISDENYDPDDGAQISGTEFSSDNSKIYVSINGGTTSSPLGGIFCYDFVTQQVENLVYDSYRVSHLQLDINGFIYAVDNDGSNLGQINPFNNSFTPSYLNINIFSSLDAGGILSYSLPDLIDYNSILSITASTTFETCASTSDGTATVYVNGGVPPYSYLWDDPSQQTTQTANNLAPGSYTCLVTDAFNSSISIEVEINTDPALFSIIGDWQVYGQASITDATIDGNIYIHNGGTFIIDGHVEFNANKGIIVHAGGSLFISNNSILSGLEVCNDNYWDGIDVEENGEMLIENICTIRRGDVIFETGTQLEYANKSIFCKDNSIIIKPGAKLTLDTTTVRAIGTNTWQGIQVWGNREHNQWPDINGIYAQGYLRLNGADIENAIVAVDLWKPDDYSKTGGIIYSRNSVFRNNVKSVHALYYTNSHPVTGEEMDYQASFSRNIFELDVNYPAAQTFFKHVDLCQVRGVKFYSCDFILSPNVPDVSSWNMGIGSYSAGFTVNAFCASNTIPCNEYDNSTFTGFKWAINANSIDESDRTFSVYRAIFNDNDYGIRTSQVDNIVVLNSIFNIGYNNSENKDNCDIPAGYGIHLQEALGFAIEENSFTKVQEAPPGVYIGIYLNNTESNAEIYKNNFSGLSCANYAQGKNYVRDIWDGLKYFCNINTLNYTDFYVDTASSIQAMQGDETHVTGNTFSQNATWNFNNRGLFQIGTYYCERCPYENPTMLYHTTKQAILMVNQCPSHYGGGPSIVMNEQQKTDLQIEYATALADYNNVKTLYYNLEDDGNTEMKLSEVDATTSEDMWERRSQLLGTSPHLSEDVLKAVADKSDVFPESVIFEILAANPDELKKDALLEYLEEKENPLPAYMIDILRQVAEGVTYKTVLQQQMAKHNRIKTSAANDMIRSYLNDTIVYLDELRNWLDNLGGIAADRQIIATYIQEGNYSMASSLANMLPDLYNLQGKELEEYNNYMSMLNLELTLHSEDRKLNELTSSEIEMLDTIALANRGRSAAKAKNILEAYYGQHFCNCPEIDGTESYKSGIVDLNAMAESFGLSITVKPNPAIYWAAFDYTLPGDETSAILIITDATGKQIESFQLQGKQGQKVWDTHSAPAGIYNYTLQVTGFIKTGIFVIVK